MQLLRFVVSCAGVVFLSASIFCVSVNGQYEDHNGHVGKKGTVYADSAISSNAAPSCRRESDFDIGQDYIIRTKDSKAQGAVFLSAESVRTFDVCLERCCLFDSCDTTIFLQGTETYSNADAQANCYLFECRPEGKTGPNLCLFQYHSGYVSSIKNDVGGFQKPVMPVVPQEAETFTTSAPVQLIETVRPTPPPQVVPAEPVSLCPADYFECDSGQCINALYICNTVQDCDDGSDEYRCGPDVLGQDEEEVDTAGGTDSAPSRVDVVEEGNPPVAVTVVAPPQEEEEEGEVAVPQKSPAGVKVNNTSTAELGKGEEGTPPEGKASQNIKEEEEDSEETYMESRGGSGMPPASSAILPLVIGLIITVCLLLMVGCRLRYMNQRLRYGRLKTSANDADYLINGMYL